MPIPEREARKAFAKRLKEATGCHNISDLSKFFDVAHSTASSWIRNMRLPVHQDNFLRLRGINPEWISTGEGEKHLEVPTFANEPVELKIACPLKMDLLRMLNACDHCSAWSAVIQTPPPKQ